MKSSIAISSAPWLSSINARGGRHRCGELGLFSGKMALVSSLAADANSPMSDTSITRRFKRPRSVAEPQPAISPRPDLMRQISGRCGRASVLEGVEPVLQFAHPVQAVRHRIAKMRNDVVQQQSGRAGKRRLAVPEQS